MVLGSVFDLEHLTDELSYLYNMAPSPMLMRYVSFIMLTIRDMTINEVDLSQYVNVSDIATAYIATTLAIPLYLAEKASDLYKTWLLEAKNLAGKYLVEDLSYSDFIHKEAVIVATILSRLMHVLNSLDLEKVVNPNSVYDLFYLSQLLKVVRIFKNIEYRAASNTNLYDLYKIARNEILSILLETMLVGSEIREKLLYYAPLSARYLKIPFSNNVKTLSIRYFRHTTQEFNILSKVFGR
jgi:hypothetical protein